MAEAPDTGLLADLKNFLSDTLEGIDQFDPNFGVVSASEALASLPEGIRNALGEARGALAEKVGDTVAEIVTAMVATVFKTLDLGGVAVGTSLGLLQAYMEVGRQNAFNLIQPTPLNPIDLIPLVFRGQLNFDSWTEEIKNNGVSADRGASLLAAQQPILTAEQVLNLRRKRHFSDAQAKERLDNLGYDTIARDDYLQLWQQLIDANSLLALWLRKDIDELELDKRMAELGLEERERTSLKTLAFFIPPVQDIIRFAVREAYEPDQIAELGLDKFMPAEFVRDAALQGVSEDWAKKYWASHWDLPSVGQVHEMFQRDIITQEQLEAAYKALDIAPNWAPFLTAIAFIPMGRIDIRRAFRLGVLTKDDMVTRYRHTGYSPEDAKILADFTELDVNDSLIGQGEARVTTLFREGFLTEAEFRDFLDRMGRTPEQIELMVSTQLLIREADHVKDLTRALRSQFNKRRISAAEVSAKLALFGVPVENITLFISEWTETREAQRTNLSLADSKKAFSKGIIDQDTFRRVMGERGLADEDVDILIRLLSGDEPQETPEPEPVTGPADLVELLGEAGLTVSPEQAIQIFTILGQDGAAP